MPNNKINLLVSGYSGIIHTLSFDPVTSELSIESSTTLGGVAPTWLTLNHDHSIVYVCDEWGDIGENHHGSLSAFSISPSTSQLSLMSTTSSNGAWPCHSLILPSSNHLVVANYGGSNITSVPILNQQGGILDVDVSHHQIISFKGIGNPLGPKLDRQDISHPHGCFLDPTTESFVLVPDLGTDEIRVFKILSVEEEDSKLGFGPLEMRLDLNLTLPPGSGPRHLLFTTSPDGNTILYILNELSNSISVYSVSYPSSDSINFTLLQDSISTLPSQPFAHQTSFSTWHASELILSPSNSAICITNRAEDISPLESTPKGPQDLFFISKLSSSGLLLPNQSKLIETGGRCPRHFQLSPSRIRFLGELEGSFENEEVEMGRYLVVGLQDSDLLIIYKREEMKEVARLEGIGRPAVVLWL